MPESDTLAEFPIVIHRKRGRIFWRILQLLVIALYALIIGSSHHDIDEEPLLLVAGVAATLVVLLELVLRWRARTPTLAATIDESGVEVTSGKEPWREPLSGL